MNKKILIVIIMFLVLLFSGVLIGIRIKNYHDEKIVINNIKSSYSPYVITTKKKNIYIKENNKYKKIGNINKNTVLSLIEKDVKNKEDIYYQIKDTDYYIDYKNIKEQENYVEDISLDNYLVTKFIKTTKTNLYQDDNLKVELDSSLEFDVLKKENDKYYVKYLDGIYYIKDSYELIDKQLDIKTLKDISVFNFSDDITINKLEEVLKYFSENNYKSIGINDFKLWINGNVELEDNKVLLLSYKELTDDKKEVVNKYNYNVCTNLDNISFTSGDTKLKVGDTKYYKYEINNK